MSFTTDKVNVVAPAKGQTIMTRFCLIRAIVWMVYRSGKIAVVENCKWSGRAKSGDGKQPNINIALYEYGNDGLSSAEGYIRQVSPLTEDLDVISEKLFSLSTNGGNEFCGQVIKLPWINCVVCLPCWFENDFHCRQRTLYIGKCIVRASLWCGKGKGSCGGIPFTAGILMTASLWAGSVVRT